MEQKQSQQLSNSNSAATPGGWVGRLLEKPLFWVFFVSLSFGIPIYRSVTIPQKAPLPVLAKIPDFQLSTQDNKVVGLKDFLGSVLIVNFIFTSCPNTCPLLTQQMKKIEDRVSSARTNVKLVSISVDPQTDTPTVLKAYGEKYRADFKQWTFLTGPLKDIEKVVVEGFKIGLDRQVAPTTTATTTTSTATTLMDITHGEHFVIVDQAGQIRAFVRADNNDQINEIVRKVAILMNTPPPRAR